MSKPSVEPADARAPGEPGRETRPLRQDVRMLGFELGRVLKRYGGSELFDLVEQVRGLAKRRRAGDPEAEAMLRDRLTELSVERLRDLTRSLASFFDLANLAEDRHRVRVLRQRERERHPAPRGESVGAAIEDLVARGATPGELQDLIDSLNIELVFTAHPTEAKRRTVRETLRRLRGDLSELDRADLLPRERERVLSRIVTDLDCLWETDTLRPNKPTVIEEVRRSLFAADSAWRVVPTLYRSMRQALARALPGQRFHVGTFLRFGSWIGGDRDGNPLVTPEVTRQALSRLRTEALTKHLAQCDRLRSILSISETLHPISPELGHRLAAAIDRWPEARTQVEAIHPHERYRQWLVVVRYRLEQTLATEPTAVGHGGGPEPDAAYRSAAELTDDLELVVRSLRAHGHDNLADGELRDWLDRVAVFGFHLTALDIREDSRRLHEAVGELAARLGLCGDYAGLDEAKKQAFLTRPIDGADFASLDRAALGDAAAQTLGLFELLGSAAARGGAEALGVLIVSMTHHPSDALTMYWLCQVAGRLSGEPEPLRLPIVPLFETIDDLDRAGTILTGMLGHRAYGRHVERSGGRQVCMVGYSDSTKDGGVFSANWRLYEGQRRLAEVARSRGLGLVLFHGRGGALGRGGGPAARGVLSLPPHSVAGRIRITEQGEVLAERYDDPEVALRHLEQVTWATMLVSARQGVGAEPADADWAARLDRGAQAGFAAYRALVQDPGFVPYFSHATPIDSIESLPIGSRPSRRRGQRALENLRAIPYTFAWTQNRHMLTAFFSLGTGLEAAAWAEGDQADWDALAQMYDRWPTFRAMIDNAELALAKCDLAVGRAYAALSPDSKTGTRIWETIRVEYDRSRAAVLRITGRSELLEQVPWLARSITVRNPYVDALNFIQVELMRRLRELEDRGGDPEAAWPLEQVLRLSVQGVAAGLRTTG